MSNRKPGHELMSDDEVRSMNRTLYESFRERQEEAERETALAYRPIAPQRQMMRDSVGIMRSLWGVARAWIRERRTIRQRRHDAGR